MKYMGSKRHMLENGLGSLIYRHAQWSDRFVDLFSGSGVVSQYACINTDMKVLAVDLQKYSAILAGASVERTRALNAKRLWSDWTDGIEHLRSRSERWTKAVALHNERKSNARLYVRDARRLTANTLGFGFMWRAYGGYYYSPLQALTLDYLFRYLPTRKQDRTTCLAALIRAASRLASAPGHTAQPFAPSGNGGRYILRAWRRSVLPVCKEELETACVSHAKAKGSTLTADALHVARTQVVEGDLVFVDPPYGAVQYSRFYHVLESLARGRVGKVEGTGRYPKRAERPQSDYCKKQNARQALEALFAELSDAKAKVIVTFPAGKSGNGLSGTTVRSLARKYFRLTVNKVAKSFSTLGGNNKSRRAWTGPRKELLLLLRPK